jgi:hypothetical protein
MESRIQLRELLRTDLKIGDVRSSGALSLVPLYGGTAGPNYLLAAEAIQKRHLEISEVPGGSVPELVAKNVATKPVLILDGEHLEGAMQDRVLNTTVLVAAASKTVLPVSCVESGRWHYEGDAHFKSSPDFSYSRLRGANLESVGVNVRMGMGHTSDQGGVWDEVANKHAELGVAHSDTGAMKDAFALHHQELEVMLDDLKKPEAGQTGVAALTGGEVAAIDLFDRADTLERLWPRLLRGYALDALGTTNSAQRDDAVTDLIAQASEGEMTAHEGVGLGEDVVVTSRSVIGKALVIEGAVVHMSLFPRKGDEGARDGSRIDSPRRRRVIREIN